MKINAIQFSLSFFFRHFIFILLLLLLPSALEEGDGEEILWNEKLWFNGLYLSFSCSLSLLLSLTTIGVLKWDLKLVPFTSYNNNVDYEIYTTWQINFSSLCTRHK